MTKKLIRLTESDLHRIVKESVQKILMKPSNITEVSSEFLMKAFDKAYRDMNKNWNDNEIRMKRGKQCGNFSRGAREREKIEQDVVCPQVPKSELKNMPKDTFVILDGKGRDYYGDIMYRYSGRAGTREQCISFAHKYYQNSFDRAYEPIIASLETYFQYYA